MRLAYVLTLLACSLSMRAATFTLNSDLVNELNFTLTSGFAANVPITPHPAWQPNGADYFWVSYDETGYGGNSPVNVPDPIVGLAPNFATAIFFELFTISHSANGSVTVWADDTARVSLLHLETLNTTQLFEANPVQDGACASGSIACEPQEGQTINLNLTSGGTYALVFEAYQRGGGPFGLMYTGAVSEAPEPATMGVIGLGLAGVLGLARRYRAR